MESHITGEGKRTPKCQDSKRPLSRTATPRGFPKHTQMRLICAQKGGIPTNNVINLFNNKKEDATMNSSDLIAPKSTIDTISTKHKNAGQVFKQFDEEHHEVVLAVKNYDVSAITTQDSGNELRSRNPFITNKCSYVYKPSIDNFKSTGTHKKVSSNVNQKVTHLIQKGKIKMYKDVSLQNSSISVQRNHQTLRKKHSVEIQQSERDIITKSSLIGHSEIPVQCSFENHFEIFENEDEGDSLAKNERDKDLVHRTLQTNARLKRIIKKLISTQRHQKLHHNWRRYINDLKNKHRPEDLRLERLKLENKLYSYPLYGFCSQSFSGMSQYMNKNKCDIDNMQSFKSGVDSYSYLPYNVPNPAQIPSRTSSPSEYGSRRINPFCYPSICTNSFSCGRSSHPRHLRKGLRNIYSISNSEVCERILTKKTCARENAIDDNFDYNNESRELVYNIPLSSNVGQRQHCATVDASSHDQFNHESDVLPSVPEESNNFVNSYSRSTKKRTQSSLNKGEPNKKMAKSQSNYNNGISKSSLSSIENKLDVLIDSIHAFMNEVKCNRSYSKKSEDHKCTVGTLSNLDSKMIKYFRSNTKINKTNSDPYGISAGDRILQSMGKIILANANFNGKCTKATQRSCDIKLIVSSKMHTKSTNTFGIEPNSIAQKYDKNYETSNTKYKADKNQEVICNEYPHALQLTVDFLVKEPTKVDHPKVIDENIAEKENQCREIKSITTSKPETVVTTMVSKMKSGLIIDSSVNTEPLTLQQISKQTIGKLLSYFPLVNYYLSFLQLPQICPCKPKMFSCHICGRSFYKPSDLNEHIRTHNCGLTRDCAVCRELLSNDDGTSSIRAIIPIPKLFTCQYCGQQFTRAYCKQLHELSCGEFRRKSIGQESSFVLLR